MDEILHTAYLREFGASNQCELMFKLNVDLEEIGLLQQEVQAVRQITDNVESLLQHIVNKIKKSIKTLQEGKQEAEMREVEVNVSLKNELTRKPIPPSTVLKNLINTNTCGMEFQIFDQRYFVVINAPLVKEFKLPLILYADNVVQPCKFWTLFTDKGKSQFSWFKSKDKENWTKLVNTFNYKVATSDVDHFLKLVCVPCNSILTGPPAEVVSENKVAVIGELPTCPFEERHKFTTVRLTHTNFRFVSYNVLSSRYTEAKDSFPYCPPQFLAVDYRKQLTTKELLGYQADIICLQEVDSNIFSTHYKDIFGDEGYMGFYHKKGNKISEGLACFFNKHRFMKVADQQIIYSDEIKQNMFMYLWNFVKINSDLKDLFLKQMTSLHVTVLKLKSKKGNRLIIVGNTHLFYRPDAELIRLIQINMATTYLSQLSRHYAQKAQVQVILCGDFNSVPTSPVFEYLTHGSIGKTHRVFQNIKRAISLSHRFDFESACGVPQYTNYTEDFKDCLDYIFIEKNKIEVTNFVPFPSEEELAVYDGLPNEVYPSDHLALVADLNLMG